MAEIKSWPENSPERKAYNAVAEIPFVEPNDENRLGYHVFLYLNGEIASIDEAIHVAQARMKISKEEAAAIISSRLEEAA